jgi:hypothetical protein
MLRDPNMQKMLYPYLPEPMRNPQSIEWMLNNPEVRKQMEGVFAQSVSNARCLRLVARAGNCKACMLRLACYAATPCTPLPPRPALSTTPVTPPQTPAHLPTHPTTTPSLHRAWACRPR